MKENINKQKKSPANDSIGNKGVNQTAGDAPKVNKNEAQNAKHTAIVRFWTTFRSVLDDLPVWKCAATEIHSRSNNLFYKMNHPYLAAGTGVVNFKAFCFSIGALALPASMEARREGRWVTLTWSDNSDLGGCSPDDELVLGYFYDRNPEAPRIIRHTGVCRRNERVMLEIPVNKDPEGEILHLYPFFVRKDLNRFSKNYYFKV